MLEVEGVNGNIDIRNGNILDSIIETVNGTVTFGATPENLSVSLVNGDVRLTIKEDNLKSSVRSFVHIPERPFIERFAVIHPRQLISLSHKLVGLLLL